jgi:hypothetical protein
LTSQLGPRVVMTPRVAVGRLIFLKLSLPRYGVVRCPAPLLLFTYAHSFLKNGADLTLYVWLVLDTCLLLEKDLLAIISVIVRMLDT